MASDEHREIIGKLNKIITNFEDISDSLEEISDSLEALHSKPNLGDMVTTAASWLLTAIMVIIGFGLGVLAYYW